LRRADRLFQIVQILQRRQLTTASFLAEELEVSVRTIYRDISDLSTSGVPVEGEAGVGYALRGFELPPMMFTRDEIESLVLGARVVETWGDPQLAAAAQEVLKKVESVLPKRRGDDIQKTMLFAPGPFEARAATVDLAVVRTAIREQQMIEFAYVDAQGSTTERIVRPLGLSFFGPTWNLTAWCELREDFRNFRPDRMSELQTREEHFEAEPGKTFEVFLSKMCVEY